MQNYLKYELKRTILSKKYIVYLFIGLLFLIVAVFSDIIDGMAYNDYLPLFVYSVFMSVFYVILPLWVAIPYALSYANERDCGIDKIITTKISKGNYVVVKYIVNVISSGLAIFIPLTVWYIIIIIFAGTEIKGKGVSVEMLFCEDFFNSNPFGFGVFVIINSTICAIIFSNLCLGFSAIIKNKIVAVLSVFIMYIFSAVVLAMIDIRLDLLRMFSLFNRGTTPYWQLAVYELFWFICGTSMYYIGCKVNYYDK